MAKIKVKVTKADLQKHRNEELYRNLWFGHKHQVIPDKKKQSAKYAARKRSGRSEDASFLFAVVFRFVAIPENHRLWD